MYEIIKQNRLIVLSFAAMLAFGVWLNSSSHRPLETKLPKDVAVVPVVKPQPPTSGHVVSEPCPAVVVEEPPAPVDFFTLLPMEKPDVAPAENSPSVTQNGNKTSEEAKPFAEETKPATIKTLPPEVPLVDSKPVGDESPSVKKTEPARPEWIPFVYYYRQSMTAYGPMKTLYIFPVASETASEPCAVYPVMPVMPICPAVPVYTPNVQPSRFGAPKLVYPNGVVIKPKVYYPNQKFRNALRAVTP